jgi:hypothetical protein
VREAAEELEIPFDVICVGPAEGTPAEVETGVGVMYRGRAAVQLTEGLSGKSWAHFTECTHEELVQPKRLHIDPAGNIHICQGVLIGNIFDSPLSQICADYRPELHPVIGPLMREGPAGLARAFDVTPAGTYVDACHLCYETRRTLRSSMPDLLGPGQVYGEEPEG